MNGRLVRWAEQGKALTGVYALRRLYSGLSRPRLRDLFHRVVAIPTENLVSGRNAAGQQEILVGV